MPRTDSSSACEPLTPTRQQHLDWCKRRALEYVEAGDCQGGITSMLSDLNKHDETRNHPAGELALMLLWAGHLGTPDKARRFIEGFN